MSSTKNSVPLSLNELIETCDRHFMSGQGLLLNKEVTDPLTWFVRSDLTARFQADKPRIQHLADTIGAFDFARDEIGKLRDALERHMVLCIIADFWEWLKSTRRQHFTVGLLKSWIDVHPLDVVREASTLVIDTVSNSTALHITAEQVAVELVPDVVAAMDKFLSDALYGKPKEVSPAPEPSVENQTSATT